MDQKCFKCEKGIDDVDLSKCPICFRSFCREHGVFKSGRGFCTRECAEYFFFGDEDD